MNRALLLALMVVGGTLAAADRNEATTVTAGEKGRELALLHDVREESELVRRSCRPLLIMVSQFACPYCETLRAAVLLPMIRSGEFSNKVLMRELMTDPGETLIDATGARVDADAFARKYLHDILAPTVLILDAEGNQLVEPLVGISNIDFYGAYLESAISSARDKILGSCGAAKGTKTG